MRTLTLALALALLPLAARAGGAWDLAKKAAGGATGKLEKELNKRLLDEGRKNQCTFRSGTADLEPGCDAKATRLAQQLIDAKKKLSGAGVKNFKFVVSGHTDSTGDAARNKELSAARAAVMVRELVRRGVPQGEIEAVGMGSERPIERPDDTPAKKARNRRYEVQVRL